jgi:hypothetical protein
LVVEGPAWCCCGRAGPKAGRYMVCGYGVGTRTGRPHTQLG